MKTLAKTQCKNKLTGRIIFYIKLSHTVSFIFIDNKLIEKFNLSSKFNDQ